MTLQRPDNNAPACSQVSNYEALAKGRTAQTSKIGKFAVALGVIAAVCAITVLATHAGICSIQTAGAAGFGATFVLMAITYVCLRRQDAQDKKKLIANQAQLDAMLANHTDEELLEKLTTEQLLRIADLGTTNIDRL